MFRGVDGPGLRSDHVFRDGPSGLLTYPPDSLLVWCRSLFRKEVLTARKQILL
jgi:hypothetical protein